MTATPQIASPQLDLSFAEREARPDALSETERRNVEWFVAFLDGRDWITAAEVLSAIGKTITEWQKRQLRQLADWSGGRIVGHQKGYKLVSAMTQEEYTWWRNETLKASDALKARVLESDKVFYGRAATN